MEATKKDHYKVFCLVQYAEKPIIITLHITFVLKPRIHVFPSTGV